MSENLKTVRAAMLVIGNEILSGRTQDTNSQWIAEKLTQHGIRLGEIRVVPDQVDMIAESVNALRHKYTYVFTTGGIGPTHDDITAESVARAFDMPLTIHPGARSSLEAYYGLEELTQARLKMARIPEQAQLIPNPVSAAPGFQVENVYVLAGVPRIMQAMFDHVLKTLQGGPPLLSNTIVCSLPESVLAEELEALQKQWPDVEIGSYPHYRGGTLGLSIVLRGVNENSLRTATLAFLEIVRDHGDEPSAMSLKTPLE